MQKRPKGGSDGPFGFQNGANGKIKSADRALEEHLSGRFF